MLALLLELVRASLLLEPIYSLEKCQSPPYKMTLFHVNSLESYTPDPDESWASMYQFIALEYNALECGNYMGQKLKGQCCYNSLDLQGSSGVASAMEIKVESDTLTFPQSADHQHYCQLKAIDQGSLDGFIQVLYLADDVCRNHVKCGLASFTRYLDEGCEQEIESFNDDGNYNSSTGWIEFNKIQVQGDQLIGWNSYTPSSLMVPTFHEPSEIMGLGMYIVCAFTSLYRLLTRFIKWIRVPSKRSSMDKWYMLLYSLGLALTLHNLFYWVIQYPDLESMAIQSGILCSFESLFTLTSTLLSTNHYVSTVLKLSDGKLTGAYVLIILVHLGLDGSNYLWYYLCAPGYYDFKSSTATWFTMRRFWIIFMFFYNFLPLIYSGYLFLRRKFPDTPRIEQVKKGINIVPLVLPLILAYLMLVTAYYIWEHLTDGQFWGDDRAIVASSSFPLFAYIFHSVINTLLIGQFKKLVRYKEKAPKVPLKKLSCPVLHSPALNAVETLVINDTIL